MEHACYRCASPVEDQTPFCPSCGAPQIRVSARESRVADPEGVNPAPDSSLTAVQGMLDPRASGKIHWKTFFRVAVGPAVVAGFASGLPLLGLLLFMGTVILVVRLYQRRSLMPVGAAQGAQMGAVFGLMSSLVTSVPSSLFCALDRTECHQALTELVNDLAASSPDGRLTGFLHSLVQSDQSLFGFFALALCFSLLLMMALGAASGAITAAFTGDRPRP